VKKMFALAALGGGLVWWRRRRAAAAEDALWAEAASAAGRDLR
jgi:hypothetical protein